MQTMIVEALCARYDADMAHAQHAARAALRLFDELQDLHQLGFRERQWVEAGALLHNVALALDERNHHTVGRDIVVGAPLKGYSHAERLMLACIVAFHEGQVEPSREPLFKLLSEAQQRQTLILSALVRIADGLDASQTQTTEIVSVERESSSVNGDDSTSRESRVTSHVKTHGPYSHEDAARAEEKADLWCALFGRLRVTGRITAPGITPDDTLAAAGRRIVRYRIDNAGNPRVWEMAFGTSEGRSGDTAKPIRKLRVATRRLRADLRIFEPYYKRKVIRPLIKGVRSLANALGPVREHDMLLANLDAYLERCDEEARSGITPLREHWRRERQRALEALLEFAGSEDYRDWLDRLMAFATTTDDATIARTPELGQPSHVRHAARAIVWQKMADVRAYDVLPDRPSVEEIHALRIAIKQLRYAVDAFREVLPQDEVGSVIARCVAAQDEYGAINDAHTAAVRARKFASHPPAQRVRRERRPAARAGGRGPARTRRSEGAQNVVELPVATRGVLTYAAAQEEVVAARMADWRAFLEPLLVEHS
jgi:CHAD domain-containing protein